MIQWSDLRQLTELQLRTQMAKVQALTASEASLRGELDRLAEQMQALALSDDSMEMMRRTGADIAWRHWAARRRAALQAEMARLRAEKLDQLALLSRALGRDEAARALQDAENDRLRRSHIARDLQQLQDRLLR